MILHVKKDRGLALTKLHLLTCSKSKILRKVKTQESLGSTDGDCSSTAC